MKRHFYIFTEFQETVYFAFFFSPFLSITSKPICLLPRLRAVYPDVSLSMKICAQRKEKKEGRRKQAFSRSHGPLRFVTSHSRVTRVWHSNLCEKRNSWGGSTESLQFYLFLALASYAKLPWLIQY